MKLKTESLDKVKSFPTKTLTTKTSNPPYNFSILSPIYDENPVSPKNQPISTGKLMQKGINNFFLDASIPLTQSKDYSQNKSINRIFSAETPIESINFKARPFTTGNKPTAFKDENLQFIEGVSPKSSVAISIFKKKVSKKTKKEDPFKMVSQYTKIQNEDFLQKMRVLSAISRRTETLILPSESCNTLEKYEEMMEKEHQKIGLELEEEEQLNHRNSFEEHEIFGSFYLFFTDKLIE